MKVEEEWVSRQLKKAIISRSVMAYCSCCTTITGIPTIITRSSSTCIFPLLFLSSYSSSSSKTKFPHSFCSPKPNNILFVPSRTLTKINFSANSEQQKKVEEEQKKNLTDSSSSPPVVVVSSEKKSFAVATGELFLGLASRIIKRTKSNDDSIKMFSEIENSDAEEYFDRKRRKSSGVTVVVEDSVAPEVIWEQPLTDLEAEMDRKKITSPGFSFSAAGLLFPYHLGVAQFLIEKDYIKETTPLAGSSAGAIVCAVIASGSSMQEALKATKILAEDCRLKGTAFRLGGVLRDLLVKFLPEDVHIRSNGRVRVAVTQILWRPRGLLVDQFDSKEDLINAVFTSSFIPGYLAPRPATLFRNRLCVDGGLTLFMPPTSASKTVRVCAFPTERLGIEGIGISPDCNPENSATPRELFKWALEPGEDTVLDRLFELGYLDAAVWAEQNPVDQIVED